MTRVKRGWCLLLGLLILCASVIGFAITVSAGTSIVDEQTVEDNGWRLTYNGGNTVYNYREMEGYYTSLETSWFGFDNWGSPISYKRPFRLSYRQPADQLRGNWMTIEFAATTDQANWHAIYGYQTIGAGAGAANNISGYTVFHVATSVEEKLNEQGQPSQAVVPDGVASKGFVYNNAANFDVKKSNNVYRKGVEYTFTFDVINHEIILTNDADDTRDVWEMNPSTIEYITEQNDPLYASFHVNSQEGIGWIDVKLVQLEALTVSDPSQIAEMTVEGEAVTASAAMDIWAGDVVRIKPAGENKIVRVGDAVYAPDAEGYCTFYMPKNGGTLTVEDGASDYAVVSFETDGGSYLMPVTVRKGDVLSAPVDPVKSGFEFNGWYTSNQYTQEFDFNTPISSNMSLYAFFGVMHEVTYRVKNFPDVIKETPDGFSAEDLTIGQWNSIIPEVDSLSLEWYADAECSEAYDFASSKIEAPTVIYGKLTETKQYDEMNELGWNDYSLGTDDNGTEFFKSDLYGMMSGYTDDYMAEFPNFGNQFSAVYSRELDVTKDIHIKLFQDAPANSQWFIIALWDNMTLAQRSQSNNYDAKYGATAAFGWNPITKAGLPTATYSVINSQLYEDENYYSHLIIRLGTEAGTSAVYFLNEAEEEVTMGTFKTAVQSDFAEGIAYLNMTTFIGLDMEIAVWQETGAELTTSYDAQMGDVQAAFVHGALTFKATPKEGYTFVKATLNGADADVVNGVIPFASYKDIVADGKITVGAVFEKIPELTGITVTAPTKTTYKAGEDLDLAGMSVTAVMSDGNNKPVSVTECEVSGFDKNKTGEQTVTVSYQGKTATFTVTVEENAVSGDTQGGDDTQDEGAPEGGSAESTGCGGSFAGVSLFGAAAVLAAAAVIVWRRARKER